MAKRKKKDGRTRSQRKMARRSIPPGRGLVPDMRYGSLLMAKFINCIMWDGKKSVAEGIVYGALDIIGQKVEGTEPIEVFNKAIENAMPLLEVKSRRVGGANYQVPIEVKPERRQALAFRWIITHARNRNEKTMALRLANELMDAFKNTGGAIKKKEDVLRMAEANKAFAHYRW
ncbi:MAG: small subunit ribosomal protein [Candidatus Sumerlaeota bacterium]|nr:small subunit ribosomal protein [Candidatus Sumerlaeota bacterium]